jgi:hypothetical protein
MIKLKYIFLFLIFVFIGVGIHHGSAHFYNSIIPHAHESGIIHSH